MVLLLLSIWAFLFKWLATITDLDVQNLENLALLERKSLQCLT